MHRMSCVLMSVLLMIADGLIVHGPSGPLVAPLGSSVVLPCSVDEPLSVDDLEVEWRRTDSDTLVLLYQDGKSQTEAQQQDYQDRANFFTEEIQHGNFSLHLNNLRAEDQGQYTCSVHSQQESGENVVQIKVDHVERLLVSGSSRSISVPVGEDVTLNCSVDSHITLEDIEEVSWKKTDEEEDIMVLLYQEHEALPEATDERYRDRVEFFSDEIPKLNFSLRLKSVRTEDKGVYMCEVFAGGLSANTTVVLQRLGFSVPHILVLILCVSASGSALLLCCLIYCRSPTKGLIVQNPSNPNVDLGGSVVLPCHVPPHLLTGDLKVEWRRRTRKSETLVHLYEDGESQAEKQHQDYKERAHFLTEHIKHGNFSLRLEKLRAEDEGEYTCTVHSKQRSVFTAKTKLALKFFMSREVIPPGGSVDLLCQVNKSLLENNLKVEWRRAEILVHLYQDGKSQAEEQHKDYQDRSHLLKKKIKDGNFSLRLEDLRAGDEGVYTCTVYKDQDCVHSADAELKLRFTVKPSHHTAVPLRSSMLLPCYEDKPSGMEGLKVEWRKKDLKDLIHLCQDGESRAEAQQQDYQDRAHFVTDEIQHGNVSLRLDNLRAEDQGEYTCTVHSQQRSVFSAKTNLVLKLLGSVSETVCCCALYFLRPLLLLWAAPYLSNFTGKTYTWILRYSYVAEYVVLSLVVYSALFSSAWQKLLNYDVFDRVVIIVMFVIVFVCCLCKTIYILVTEVGKKSGRIIEIFGLVADMNFEILPTLQFMLLFYTFGAGDAGFMMIVILPVLMMMTNERWFYKCYGLGFSYTVVRTVVLIFILLTNAAMIGLYIFTLDEQTDPIRWGCVMLFLQILWTVMYFTDFGYFSRDFHRYVVVYVFGSVAVVLLNSAALITELILKSVTGDRVMEDLRFTVFPSECLFVISLLISALLGSKIAGWLKSCQTKVRSFREKRSQQNQNTAEEEEMSRLSSGDPDSVWSQS